MISNKDRPGDGPTASAISFGWIILLSIAHPLLRLIYLLQAPLVEPSMMPITRGLLRAREIWIDDTLCRAARCRRVALGQRRVAAFVIVGPAVHVQTNRRSRIVGLGGRRPY